MNAIHKDAAGAADSTATATINVRRRIAAPAELLFAAWLDPAVLAQWMRPGSTVRTDARIDPVVGGKFHIDMHQPDSVVPHHGTYVEIDAPRRLAFTWHSPHTGGRDSLVTIDFDQQDGATEISLTHEQLPENKAAAHTGGWTDALRNLAAMVERAADG